MNVCMYYTNNIIKMTINHRFMYQILNNLNEMYFLMSIAYEIFIFKMKRNVYIYIYIRSY